MATNNMINTAEPFPVAIGGTGSASVVSSPTASAWAGWDANKNASAVNFISGYSTTATAAGTTTLTVGSNQNQYFTGSTTQTLVMPVANTLVVGMYWNIVNNSSGVVTIKSSGGNTILALPANSETSVTCVTASGTSAASWVTSPAVSGSGTVSSGLINQLAWYAASGTAVSGLATANSGVLVTSGGGVPSISTTLPNAINLGAAIFPSLQAQSNGAVLYGSDGAAVMAFFISGGTSVNSVEVASATTGNHPFLQGTGTDTNVVLDLRGQGNGGAAIQGTTAGGNAVAGYVGEYVTSNVAQASAVSCSNNTPKDVTSISLTAGDWDVIGNLLFTATSATNPSFQLWCSTTSATIPDNSITAYSSYIITTTTVSQGIVTPFLRLSLSATTTVYVSCNVRFSAGSATACGSIFARRVR